jgi:hypothetical protein
VTCEAQSFANRLGVESPRGLPRRPEEFPSRQYSNIPLFMIPNAPGRWYSEVPVSSRLGRQLRTDFAEQSQFAQRISDGNSCVEQCLWRTRLGKGCGKQSQFPQSGAVDCGFRGGGRWRILICLMDAGPDGVENRSV